MKVTLAIAAFILTVGAVRADAADSSCVASLNEAGAADWMRGKVGGMVHWLYPSYGDADRWADVFDAKAFLADFERTGAEWLIFTAGQCRGVYCSPSEALDAYCGPGHTTKRDILSEVARGVKSLGRRFIVYSAVDFVKDGCIDHSMQRGLCWYTNSSDRAEFQRRWTTVLGGWARRLGSDIDGWWLDGAGAKEYPGGIDVPLWEKALRAGNPKAVWAFNKGVYEPSWAYGSQYTAGEICDFRSLPRDGVRPVPPPGVVRHHLFPIDGYWGAFWAWPAFSRRYVDFHDRRPELFDKELMARRLERRDFPEPVCTAAELRAFLDGARRRGEAVTINIGVSPEGRLNPMSVELLRSLALNSQPTTSVAMGGPTGETVLPKGIVFVDSPLKLTARDSGRRFVGAPDGSTVLSAGIPVKGWNVKSPGVWRANAPEMPRGAQCFESLFVNGRRAVRALHPDSESFHPGEWLYDGTAGEVLYRPLPDETIDAIEAIAPRAGFATLVEAVGANVTFDAKEVRLANADKLAEVYQDKDRVRVPEHPSWRVEPEGSLEKLMK